MTQPTYNEAQVMHKKKYSQIDLNQAVSKAVREERERIKGLIRANYTKPSIAVGLGITSAIETHDEYIARVKRIIADELLSEIEKGE